MPHVKNEILEKLKNDEELLFAVAQGMGKKFRTAEKWVRDNDEILASKAVVLIIMSCTDWQEDEIISSNEYVH